MKHITIFVLLAGIALSIEANAQTEYSKELLSVKKRFAINEINALSRKFMGITSGQGKRADLFPLKLTGVSNDQIYAAAAAFLEALSSHQKLKTQFSVDDPEWRKWSNVDSGIYVRQGISFEEMSANQKRLAWKLLQESLSENGIDLSKKIMRTDQTLKELNDDELSYGEEKYFITLMGIPSKTEPWGWQLDGHHLVINYFVLGDQVVVTPMFLGAEPSVATSGKYIGNSVLQVDLQAQAGKDNLLLEDSGISAKSFSSDQKALLTELILLFVDNIRDEHAAIRMEEVVSHLDSTTFSWIGGTDDQSIFYYRIYSPVILIEFDHQSPVGNPNEEAGRPTRQHIHVIVRTPNGNDDGKDLLRQHLATHKH